MLWRDYPMYLAEDGPPSSAPSRASLPTRTQRWGKPSALLPQAVTHVEHVEHVACAHGIRLYGVSGIGRSEMAFYELTSGVAQSKFEWKNAVEIEPTGTQKQLSSIHEAIATAFGGSDALASAKKLDELWERIDTEAAFAETKMRLLLKRLPKLALADSPLWLSDELDSVDGALPETLDTAMRLARATIHALGGSEDLRASAASLTGGGVELTWAMPGGLTWLVYPPRLAWPGLHVRAYAVGSRGQFDGRTFHLAHSAVEHATQVHR